MIQVIALCQEVKTNYLINDGQDQSHHMTPLGHSELKHWRINGDTHGVTEMNQQLGDKQKWIFFNEKTWIMNEIPWNIFLWGPSLWWPISIGSNNGFPVNGEELSKEYAAWCRYN